MEAAAASLDAAAATGERAHAHRDALTIEVLRAVVARRRREPGALERLVEARSLARIGGNERLIVDTHPLAVQLEASGHAQTTDAATPPRRTERRPALRGGLLTSKEAEILALLDRGMSNKSIARAMEISHETVKWHVKNLSLKLSAGTRQHAVDRARMLGLLAP
jgi:LuxR family maltose regulon positive regulatory protein